MVKINYLDIRFEIFYILYLMMRYNILVFLANINNCFHIVRIKMILWVLNML